MPRSEAQKKADKKYVLKTYKRYAINTRLEYVPRIDEYCAKYGFDSASGVFNTAIKYVIDNDIPLTPNQVSKTSVSWTDEVFEKFIDMADLTEFEQEVLESRIEGLTIKEQAEHLHCSTSKISSAIKRIKLMYDSVQLQCPETFPKRRISDKEKYLDEN